MGADCADFGCRQEQRQCSGPGKIFLGADCADRDKDSADRDKDSADRDKDSADRDKDSAAGRERILGADYGRSRDPESRRKMNK